MEAERDGPASFNEGSGTIRAGSLNEGSGTVRARVEGSGTIRAVGEGSGTISAVRDGTVKFSQGKVPRNSGWDSNMDVVQGTGTIRSAVKPPPVAAARDKKSDSAYNLNLTRKLADGENRQMLASATALDELASGSIVQKDAQSELDNKRLENSAEDDHLSVSGSGTVVLRSPRETQVHTAFSNQSSKPVSRFTSSEDVSISSTVVLRDQHDESDTARTPKSRLGIQEKTSSASSEDSALNLAEAKAALQGGLRKGNARERPLGKHNKYMKENKVAERTSTKSPRESAENFDAHRGVQRSLQLSDGDGSTRASAAASSPVLSLMIIPSLKEAAGDRTEGPGARSVIDALIDLEQQRPGSCEAFVGRLLHRLGSCKEPSVKGLQEVATRAFTRNSQASQDAAESKKQSSVQLVDNPNLSPLARFLLSRWQSQVAQDLNSV